MKRSTRPAGKSANNEGIRRTQQSGRQQASKSTQRITQYLGDDQGSRTVKPEDAAIDIPSKLKRYFALGLLGLIIITLVYAIGNNLGSLQSLVVHDVQATKSIELTPRSGEEMHIGIVSGHRGNDSGAVCKDGLTEADINYNVAKRVSAMLVSSGYTVDILDEFDTRLKGYRAAVLLSIHADSCAYINELATGFKVARVVDSRVPVQEDRLVACLTAHYQKATSLRFHANTVTFDMTKYHAFYEINAYTPAAIIETGFLNLDRNLLTGQPDLVAQGIYNGLICFINNEQL